jgi:hypothetical protein
MYYNSAAVQFIRGRSQPLGALAWGLLLSSPMVVQEKVGRMFDCMHVCMCYGGLGLSLVGLVWFGLVWVEARVSWEGEEEGVSVALGRSAEGWK